MTEKINLLVKPYMQLGLGFLCLVLIGLNFYTFKEMLVIQREQQGVMIQHATALQELTDAIRLINK